VAATDGPYTGMEGAAVTLSGAASSDPDGDVLTYAWDFGDGTTGTGATPQHTYADNGNYIVTLTVTDPAGAEATTTTSVTVFNVAPTVNAFAGGTVLPNQAYAATGSFGDPGADSWTATVDYGDGSGAQPLALSGTSFSLSHAYAAAGSYTVTVTVTDDDGSSASKTATVTVLTAQQGIANLVAQVNGMVSGGTASSMEAKLRSASASIDRGNTAAANGQLGAFINEVNALVQSGRLTAAQGAALTAAAQTILNSIA
jgi:PKD repeat protein